MSINLKINRTQAEALASIIRQLNGELFLDKALAMLVTETMRTVYTKLATKLIDPHKKIKSHKLNRAEAAALAYTLSHQTDLDLDAYSQAVKADVLNDIYQII